MINNNGRYRFKFLIIAPSFTRINRAASIKVFLLPSILRFIIVFCYNTICLICVTERVKQLKLPKY